MCPSFLVGKVVPYQLVSSVTADVVEGADLLVPAFDQQDRGPRDFDLLGHIAAHAGISSTRATLSHARLNTASRSSSKNSGEVESLNETGPVPNWG